LIFHPFEGIPLGTWFLKEFLFGNLNNFIEFDTAISLRRDEDIG